MNPYTYVCDLPVQNVTSAQEAIERALLALNEEKEIYQITVRELCGRANVARSTFYAYKRENMYLFFRMADMQQNHGRIWLPLECVWIRQHKENLSNGLEHKV